MGPTGYSDEPQLWRSNDTPGSMTAGIQQWVSKVLAAVQQQHDIDDLRNLVARRCSGPAIKAALDLAFNLKCWPFPHVYLHHANRVTSDAGVPVSSAARLPPPVLRQH